MKRSLGLHCTILRISTQAADKDTTLETSRWLSAGEELAKMDDPRESPKISPADIQSLHKFTRDMVTQSVIPHMERCITMWNDQVSLSWFDLMFRSLLIVEAWRGESLRHHGVYLAVPLEVQRRQPAQGTMISRRLHTLRQPLRHKCEN